MKKSGLMLIALAAGILGLPQEALAEVSVSGTVDMAVIPFQFILDEDAADSDDKATFGAGLGSHGAGEGARAVLDVEAEFDEVIGMRVQMQVGTDGAGIDDYLQAWWQPIEQLRFDAGRFLNDRLRGRIDDADERMNANNVRMYDGDAIFSRFKTHRYGGQAGFMVSAQPIEYLWLGAMLYDLVPFEGASSSTSAAAFFDAHPDMTVSNADAFHRVQAAFGYNITKSIVFRAQYLGAKPMVEITHVGEGLQGFDLFNIIGPRVEIAFGIFGLPALPGLIFDVGGKIPLPFADWDRGVLHSYEEGAAGQAERDLYEKYQTGCDWQAPYQVSVGLRFVHPNLQSLEIVGRLDAKFFGRMKGGGGEVKFGEEINFHVWPSWDFLAPYTDKHIVKLILDFGMEYIGETSSKGSGVLGEGTDFAMNGGSRYGAGISVQRNILPNCFVKAGVAYKFAGTVNSAAEKGVLSIPIHLEYNF